MMNGTSVDFTVAVPNGMAAALQLPAGATVVGKELHNGRLELSCGTTELKINI
jgi:hypothetical protein